MKSAIENKKQIKYVDQDFPPSRQSLGRYLDVADIAERQNRIQANEESKGEEES